MKYEAFVGGLVFFVGLGRPHFRLLSVFIFLAFIYFSETASGDGGKNVF